MWQPPQYQVIGYDLDDASDVLTEKEREER